MRTRDEIDAELKLLVAVRQSLCEQSDEPPIRSIDELLDERADAHVRYVPLPGTARWQGRAEAQPLFATNRMPVAPGNRPPPWLPPMGGPVSDELFSHTTSFLASQPQLIVCGQFGLTPLRDEERRELLAAINLYDALEIVARVQAQWDMAYTTTHNVRDIECEFLADGGEGGLCEKVINRIIIFGDMLISPRATAQLQREIIEYASADHTAPAIDRNTLIHLLLSITTEQNSDAEFAGDVPSAAEIAKLQRKLPKMDADELHEYAKPHIQNEIASALFNHPLRMEIVLSNTYDLWFTEWAARSKTTDLGATPAEAFKIATGVELLDIMRLGHRIIKRSTNAHQVRFTRNELLADGATESAIDYLFANMAPRLDDFRAKLQEDREAGPISHQRYTLTRFPFLAVDDNTFVVIRHQWAHDRLCGGPLYFEAWARLSGSTQKRFKIAMNDAFEKFVGTILHRIHYKCPHLRVIVDEDEMQAAWAKKKGKEPSVCDWILFGKDHCIVIDATNHAVKEDAAQGLASWDEYSADIEKIFMDTDSGKYKQLLSTIDLVQKHEGWGNEKVDNKTMYAPLVIVPDAGVVNGILTQFDINIRSIKAFKHLQPQVYAPGIVPLSDLQLLEGMADIGAKGGMNPDMMDLIAKWRISASKGVASLQLYLRSYGAPILPVSDHIMNNSRRVIRLLGKR